MKRVMTGLLAVAALVAAADRAAAQGTLPLTAEVRLDAGIPTGDLADAFDVGLGWGVQAGLDLSPQLTVFGGYSRFEFNEKGDSDLDVKDDGFDLGGRVRLGSGLGMLDPFAQFAVLFHDDTGFEAGLGADYPVGVGIALTPLARFRKVGDAQYFGVGIGLSLRP